MHNALATKVQTRTVLRWLMLPALLLTGCAVVLKAAGYPPYATRTAPPPGLATKALAVGAAAPEFTLATSEGGSWALGEAVREGPVVLVFYRGAW